MLMCTLESEFFSLAEKMMENWAILFFCEKVFFFLIISLSTALSIELKPLIRHFLFVYSRRAACAPMDG